MKRLLLLAYWVALPAFAQTVDCEDAVTQSDMNICASLDWEEADDALNEAYRAAIRVMKQIDSTLPAAERGAEDVLRRAQRAWVPVRDATCEANGFAMKGGSAQPLVIYGCMAQLTRERTEILWAIAESY